MRDVPCRISEAPDGVIDSISVHMSLKNVLFRALRRIKALSASMAHGIFREIVATRHEFRSNVRLHHVPHMSAMWEA